MVSFGRRSIPEFASRLHKPSSPILIHSHCICLESRTNKGFLGFFRTTPGDLIFRPYYSARSTTQAPDYLTTMISSMLGSLRHHVVAGHCPRIVVLGGSYAGISAVQNMLGLLEGRGLRPSPIPQRVPELLPTVKPSITVLDRRDGFCQSQCPMMQA